jgi:hypothetical protein
MMHTRGRARGFTLVELLLLGVVMTIACQQALATSVSLTPIVAGSGDGTWQSTTINGTSVWQNTGSGTSLYFDVPGTISQSGYVYVQVQYYDQGVGTTNLEYDSSSPHAPNPVYAPSETHSRSSRIGTNGFVYSYHRLEFPHFVGGQNYSADFRVRLADADGTALMAVHSVVVQDTPFTASDSSFATFQQALTKPWLAAYPAASPSRDDVTTASLKDKVMCGYQGWFNAPNDLQDTGWWHWCKSFVMKSANFNTDMWPDMTDYPATSWVGAASVHTASGKQAYVFSDADPDAVRTQFKWMRKHNIDGVFLQRFLKSSNLATSGYQQWAVANVRQAAHLEGRVWVIEYDLSSIADANLLSYVEGDWNWLTSTSGFDLLHDSRYGYENGKPVVVLYGMGNPSNPPKNNTAVSLINWFTTTKGCYVIGGVPNGWLTNWSQTDSSGIAYSSVYSAFNAIIAWHSANYAADLSQCGTFNAQYWPIIWPGFSWSNEQYPTSGSGAFQDRFSGNFYWSGKDQATKGIYGAVSNCQSRGVGPWPMFVGMFDEFDEGTAIMPMTDDHPTATNPGCAFIGNQSQASDWWLALTAAGKEMMHGQRSVSATLPTVAELANRSNIGPQAYNNLSATNPANPSDDDAHRLYRVEVALDGNTFGETVAGIGCRYNQNPATDHYFYFNVDDNFINQYPGGTGVTIEVEYYDAPGISFTLEYDGAGGAYTSQGKTIATQGANVWRTVRFEITDAYFGNRENSGSDFRLHVTNGMKLDINRLWVRRLDSEYGTWIATAANPQTPYGGTPTWTLTGVHFAGAAVAGTIDEVNDIYTVGSGGSTDIGGASDLGFAFLNRATSGDCQIISRVNSYTSTGTGCKAGVMLRESVFSNSMDATMYVTPAGAVSFQRRTSTGGTPVTTSAGTFAFPIWLKVVRSGTTYTGYYSTDGTTWNTVASSTMTIGTSALAGFDVCSGSGNGNSTTASFQYLSVAP